MPPWLSEELLPAGVVTAERASTQEVLEAFHYFERQPLLSILLDAVPNIVLVLNEHRQIVYANRQLLKALGCQNLENVCGLRPGEVFNCVHVKETPSGCGTTEFCRTCGAVKAIMGSLLGQEMVEECRILRSTNDALEFRVWTTPFTANGQRFTVFCLSDVTHEKRRAVLERVFFHDLLNLAGALQGYVEYLAEAKPEEIDEIRQTIGHLTRRLVTEIRTQQLLASAERGDLEVLPGELATRRFLNELAEGFRRHPVSEGKTLVIDPQSWDGVIVTDRTLLSRVVENMVKNALEAIEPGQTVTVRCLDCGEQVRFEVHNPGVMPLAVQLQIFVRSYSTKGKGRGIGTYSMKLLCERYLGGKVSFESTPENGTTFRVDIPKKLEVPDAP